jgi:16S rRNA (cytosine967-C5)-methyltransferase
LQARLLDQAARLVKPGGTLVYCTCSLEPEECEDAVWALLARNSELQRQPIAAGELAGLTQLLTPQGDLRTLPCQFADADPRWSGLDGFYAARLVRNQ